MTLEFTALCWLRFEKNCRIAMFERNPRYGSGQPDVLGVTNHRYLLEIEIKRSVSDFRANARKHFHAFRNLEPHGDRYPKHFWFLVPGHIADAVRPLLPGWAGLLSCSTAGPSRQKIQVIDHAPANILAEPLTTKECVRLSFCMANQILSFARQISGRTEWDEHNEKFTPESYQI